MRFLIDYGEALRTAESTEGARSLALPMLGEHLGADRVGIAETPSGPWAATIAEEWTAPGVQPLDPTVPLSPFGPIFAQTLQGGTTLICDDVAADDRFDQTARAAFARLDIGAFVVIPWLAQGRMEGAVFLHARRPRDWSDFDITTVEGLLQRTRAWIEAERAADREHMMVREIDHRAKNALAVAQSVVRLTRAEDMDAYRRKLEERIAALARAHSLLAMQHWRSVDLRELLQAELRPYCDVDSRRTHVDGPAVSLPADLAQTTALVLHELATNAAKHGALATEEGRLDVNWRIDEPKMLHLDWTETVPRALSRQPSGRKGFGSVLLSRVIEIQLGGKLETEFSPHGLRLRIAMPLGDADAAPAPASNEERLLKSAPW